MNENAKKDLSPSAVIGAIVGLVVVLAAVAFFLYKSDPAAQAPNPPPRFNPADKAKEYNSSPLNRGPNDPKPK